METKALFLDMDGTTLDSKGQMPEGNYRALEAAIKAGHHVVVTTGRATSSVKGLIKRCKLAEIGCRYVISYNGGMVTDLQTGKVIYKNVLPVEWMKRAISDAKRMGQYAQTYEGDFVLADQDDENLAQYTKKTGMEAKLVPNLEDAIKEGACKVLFVNLKYDGSFDILKKELEKWTLDKIDIYQSCREYLEVLPKNVNKGQAVEAFCKEMGISIENAIAAGDEANDISMIQAAGVGCAVANALPEVKAVANYVTKATNDENAIQEIVEKFML